VTFKTPSPSSLLFFHTRQTQTQSLRANKTNDESLQKKKPTIKQSPFALFLLLLTFFLAPLHPSIHQPTFFSFSFVLFFLSFRAVTKL